MINTSKMLAAATAAALAVLPAAATAKSGNQGNLVAAADIVISDRWLPRECVGRWLTIERDSLAETGGLALYLGEHPKVVSALRSGAEHPWRRPQQVSGNDEAIPTDALAQ